VVDEGRGVVVDDVNTTTLVDETLRQLCVSLQVISFLNIPVIREGNVVAVVCIVQSVPRVWTNAEIELAKETVERIWSAIERANAEEALRQRESELAKVQEIGNIGGVDVDVKNNLTAERSPEYRRLHGLSPDVITESHADWKARVHPDDRARAEQQLFDALVSDSTTYENEYRIIRPADGQIRWIYTKLDIERDDNGVAERLVGMQLDTTERREAEDALRKSEEKYRAIFNSVEEGFSLLEILFDENNHPYDVIVRDANPAQNRIDGTGNVIGKRVKEVYPDIEQKWIDRYAAVAQTGEAIQFEDFSAVNTRWYTVRASRIGTTGSNLVAIVYDDITTRKRAEDRQAFILILTDAISQLEDPLAIQETAAHLLGEKLDASRVMYAEIRGRGKERQYIIARNYLAPDVEQSFIGNYPAAMFGVSLLQNGEVGQTMVVNNVQTDKRISEEEREAFLDSGILAFIMKPLVKEGEWVSAISVHQTTPRIWQPHEIEFVEEVGERTWSAVERSHAEEALKYSETRLRIVAKSSGIGTWIHHLDTDKIETDERTDEIYGLPLANYSLVDSVRLLFHPDDIGSFANAYEKATDPKGNGILNVEFRIMRPPTGVLRWLHSVGQTFFEGEPKQPVMMVGSTVDITDRKETERAISESEERYRAIFYQATACVSEMDASGNILLANDTFCYMLRYAFDEMVTLNIRDITHPDDLPHCIELLEAAVKTGDSFTNEKRLIRNDGSYVWVTESISATKDQSGQTKSVVAVGIDITERRKTEIYIHESEERYRIALEAGELATWDWHLKTDKVMWNKQHFRLFGVEHEAGFITSEYFLEFVYPEDMALVKQQLAEVVGNAGVYIAEFRIRRKDNGKLRWMSGYGRVTERENGKPTRISGVMYDSTDRREAENSLAATKNSLSTALEAAKMGVWTKDMTHGYMDRSAKHDELLGFTEWQEDWDDEKGKTNLVEEDKAKYDAASKNLVEDGVFDLEARVKHGNGSIC
ncbi:MAG: PAS domain-containing protein, partial [Mucilaginibacter polytrichastri]|nr:PAS domain-containing protein [Mucilaginibacter polytrichastri]